MQCTWKQYSENEKLRMRQTHRLIVSYKQQHHQAAFTVTGLVFFYLDGKQYVLLIRTITDRKPR